MENLRNQHVLILGLGNSGLAMSRWCAHHGAHVIVADTRKAPPCLEQFQKSIVTGIFIHCDFNVSLLYQYPITAIFKSPGIIPSQYEELFEYAKSKNIVIGNELTLYDQAIQTLKNKYNYNPYILAITGTNGKTTVTSLIAHLLKNCGQSVVTAGNIGPTMLDVLSSSIDISTLKLQEIAPHLNQFDLFNQPDRGNSFNEPDIPSTSETVDFIVKKNPTLADFLPQTWVLELSSFQLDEITQFNPTAATVLNITQDHLDWHRNFEHYKKAKSNIFGEDTLMVLNREDDNSMHMLSKFTGSKLSQTVKSSYITFGKDKPQRAGDYGIETVNEISWLVRAQPSDKAIPYKKAIQEELYIQYLMPIDSLKIYGKHNASNALAAIALAVSTQANLASILYALKEYSGEEHRMQHIATIDNILYFDDSKGTNVGATVAALESLGDKHKVIIILGGEGKGQDFSPLLEPINRYVRTVILIGNDASTIHTALLQSEVPKFFATTLEQAVEMAANSAQFGDAVLLSPACASFDMFQDYAHRAKVFCDCVQKISMLSSKENKGGV